MSAKKFKQKSRLSISMRLYMFVATTVLLAAIGTAFSAYAISAGKINNYFKRLSINTADNIASLVDSDFYERLKEVVESDDYQAVRYLAEKRNDETMVRNYLEKIGIWDEYQENLDFITRYHSHMIDIKYLYCMVLGDPDATEDMYLMDDDAESELYSAVGGFEKREDEFYGVDFTRPIEPTITNGEWGWLCSAYAPVRDKDGNIICHIGCDISMKDVMAERARYLITIIISTIVLVIAVLIGAFFFSRRIIVKPLALLTAEMKKFDPGENKTYEEAKVVALDLKYHDEVYDIYKAVRSMQMHIVDYLNRLSDAHRDRKKIKTDLEKAEIDIKNKEAELGEISQKAFIDPLTHVGNKIAYEQKIEDLNKKIAQTPPQFAVVMIDLNNLKKVNDLYGHRAGDEYIKGSCHTVCMVYGSFSVYRNGGDEFVVILEGTSYNEREELLKKVKLLFEENADNNAVSPQYRYSAAVGMAEYKDGDESFEDVFRRADNSMYENKKIFKEKHGTYR